MSGYQELTDEQWSRLKSYWPCESAGKRGSHSGGCSKGGVPRAA